MKEKQYCQFWLTCADDAEASKISHALLKKRLVACVKKLSIASDFHWKNNIENSKEVLLIMESLAEKFDQAEKLVAELHSYETFVLQAIPILRLSSKAQKWLEEEVT